MTNAPTQANTSTAFRHPSSQPSLKKQALTALYAISTSANNTKEWFGDLETIRTALESLDD